MDPSAASYASSHPTALITGASSGIGAEFARQLAAQGHDLILVARRADRLQALADQLTARFPVSAVILPADLADPTGLATVVQAIRNCLSLALLVNNAGFGVRGEFASGDLGKHLAMIQVHVVASVQLTRAALPGMVARGRGGIINVSSVAAFFPMQGSPTYAATKAYLNAFSEALAAELRGTGVKVQALCPGFTITEFHSTTEYSGRAIRSRVPRIAWLTSEKVVADSLKALHKGSVICVPGLLYQVAVFIGRTGLVGLISGAVVRRIRKSLTREE